MSRNRVDAAQEAVARWSQMDSSGWDTGLSSEGARSAQLLAASLIAEGEFRSFPTPPRRLLIWCSSNVFTAPLEWVAQFAAMGTQVLLKAPSACPKPVLALAESFSDLGVSAHVLGIEEGLHLIDDCDAILGFGSDSSMANLNAHIPPSVPRSLHGHKGSLAIVKAEDPAACAHSLIQDSLLYDGRGCMSPIAVFCLGDTDALYREIEEQGHQPALPRGAVSLAEEAHISRRLALAKLLGRGQRPLHEDSIVALHLDKAEFEFLSLPRVMPIHPIDDLSDLDFLRGLPLSSCATDLPREAINHLGFHRICSPGELQRPPMNRLHDGVDVLALLCEES